VAWNEGLDEEFISIAGFEGSHCCVIAGAGTGKSYALKRKVARLLEEGESPGSILVVTFTRTAARDLNNDLRQLGVEGCDLVRACTLHSLCFSILSKHEVFRVMERETRTLLEHEGDYLLSDISVRLGSRIRVLREQLHAFTSAWARLLHEKPGWPSKEEDRQFDEQMTAWLRFHKAMLVGELVPLTIRYLRSNPTCPERSQYKHIIVDEYQDLNRAEQELIKLLSESELPQDRTLTVAGDDDQSIFVTLKYAHPEGIISFKDEYPGTYEQTLLICKRCPRKVIELANAFITSTGHKTHPKLLKPRPDAIDGEVAIVQWRMLSHEATGIATIIANKIATGEVKPEEIMVLTPRKQIGYDIVNSLNNKGIKAQTCFSDAVLERRKKLAQEGYACLSLLHNGNDSVSLRVLLGIDANDRRSKAYERVRKHCFESGDTVIETLLKLKSGQLHIPYIGPLVDRYEIVNQRLGALSNMAIPEIINVLFPDSVDEVAEIRKLALTAQEQAADIHELFNLMNTEIVQPELPETNDSVLVLTLHKAKGLTAKMVIIVNCLEGCIPYHTDNYATEQDKQRALAEQERLFFVALTRTARVLVISSTGIMRRGDVARMSVASGTSWYWSETQSSRFIDMLGPDAPEPILGEEYIKQMAIAP
jgi:DNA helicase-2/ATP-dependent DNA helicase PcrA